MFFKANDTEDLNMLISPRASFKYLVDAGRFSFIRDGVAAPDGRLFYQPAGSINLEKVLYKNIQCTYNSRLTKAWASGNTRETFWRRGCE
jgi:hypothetical protein